MLLTDPTSINACFASFYQELYSSQMAGMDEKLYSYLEEINLLCLKSRIQNRLDSPITRKALQKAMTSLQAGKTLGPDGLLAEFFLNI